jgi:predicted nucleotidyltransferase
MGIQEILLNQRSKILEIARKHGVEDISVFGSVARGEALENSDVDFLITAGSKVSPWFPGGLVADLEELLGRKVDVVESKALRPEIRQNVIHEARPL